MKQTETRKAALIFVQILLIMAFAAGCKTPAGSEEPYTLHFTPGTYEASATGFNPNVPIKARVVFSETAILDIEIVSHGETPETSDPAFNLVPEAIVREQALIDALSGATTAAWTRKGILAAVEKCVKQAGGDEAVVKLKEGGIAKFIARYMGYK